MITGLCYDVMILKTEHVFSMSWKDILWLLSEYTVHVERPGI